MAWTYLFYTGQSGNTELSTDDLRQDLETSVIQKYGFNCVSTRTETRNGNLVEEQKMYEIPKIGSAIVQLAPENELHYNNGNGNANYATGIVTCLGFDQEMRPFTRIHEDLLQLTNKYHNLLKKKPQVITVKVRALEIILD